MFGAMSIPGRPGAGLVYLLELLYPGSSYEYGTADQNLGNVGSMPVSSLAEFRLTKLPVVKAASTQYYGTEDWTVPSSDPEAPDRWYDGRLTNPGQVSRNVSLAAVDASTIVATYGNMSLLNSDGRLDSLPDDGLLINAPVRLRVGVRGDDLSQFQVQVSGYVRSLDVSLTEASLDITGSDTLANEIFFDETYSGGGGIEGPVNLQGTYKPYVLGAVFNMQPVQIDTNRFIFQAHAGALGAITRVKYAGLDMVFTADYPTYADLKSATVSIGEYATCLVAGCIKAGLTQGGTNNYTLTCNVNRSLIQASDIAQDLMVQITNRLGYPHDAAAFAALAADRRTFAYGRVITQPLTYRDVVSDVMRNMNQYWGANRDGVLTTNRLIAPEDLPDTALEYDHNDIISVDRLTLPKGFEWPHKERTVKYKKNWAPQTTVAAQANEPFMSRVNKQATIRAPVIRRNALTPTPVESNLRDSTGARTLAQELVALHGKVRQMYGVTVPVFSGSPGLLTKVRVTYPRFDLKGGRDMVVVALTENYRDGTVQVTLWG